MDLPGYDAWKTTLPEGWDEEISDPSEGEEILKSVSIYLDSIPEQDNQDDYDAAADIIDVLRTEVRDDLSCVSCGKYIGREGCCSRICARAAEQ